MQSPPLIADPLRPKSQSVFDRALHVIPGGVNSPVRSFRSVGMSPPLIAASGRGDTIYDIDGHTYIDYCGSWGALIHGHTHPAIVQAATEQIAKGSSFGIATEIEERVARKVVELVPSIEKVRFVCSGTEAGMTAMRLARGFTGRAKIVKFSGHYHGHADSFLIQAGSGAASLNPLATSKGVTASVLADTICLPFNDIAAIRALFDDSTLASQIAAVILEPVAGNMGVVLPDPSFLHFLREQTQRNGSLLIFDEVITGFRVSLQGAQGLYGIDPDLTCLGKVIGGGFPVAAVGGKAALLDCLAPLGEVYQAGTLAGNPVAMQAGYTALCLLEAPRFYQRLEEKTKRLTDPIEKALKQFSRPACLQRCGSMFSLFFGVDAVRSKEDLKQLDERTFKRFFRFLFEQGIYIPPSPHEAWFVSSVHTNEHLDQTAEAVVSFIQAHARRNSRVV